MRTFVFSSSGSASDFFDFLNLADFLEVVDVTLLSSAKESKNSFLNVDLADLDLADPESSADFFLSDMESQKSAVPGVDLADFDLADSSVGLFLPFFDFDMVNLYNLISFHPKDDIVRYNLSLMLLQQRRPQKNELLPCRRLLSVAGRSFVAQL